MCGIAGIISDKPFELRPVLHDMVQSMAHRGPDDEGMEFISTGRKVVALGHRRLSILDLSPLGHQPMVHPDSGNAIVFNGEIYNFREIRRELESAGSCFRSQSDTEVILHSYERWGSDCFSRLNGMFAIALFDKVRGRLVVARDFMGMKPLYFYAGGGRFVFSSELHGLYASGLIQLEVDQTALAGLLAYGAVQEPRTMLQGVQVLSPGCYLEIDSNALPRSVVECEPKQFWTFNSRSPGQPLNREEAIEGVRTRLIHAAQSHLISDVPVGIFLSSGIDSSSIASLCSEVMPGRVECFTVSLKDYPELDEAPVACETARLMGLKHHQVILDQSEVKNSVGDFFRSIDQPTVDGLNTFVISQSVRRQGIKVALSGLGGDELFGGYSGFSQIPLALRALKTIRFIPVSIRKGLMAMLASQEITVRWRKFLELLSTQPNLTSVYFRRRRLFSDWEVENFGLRRSMLGLDENFLPLESQPNFLDTANDDFQALSMLESRYYMGNMLLRDSDVMGMAHGLEIRVPFLDKPLVEYVMNLPGAWRVSRRGLRKPLLMSSLGDRLRPQLKRMQKMGFALPQAFWMSGPLKGQFEVYLDTLACSGLVDPKLVMRVWDAFHAGKSERVWARVWLLAVLGSWIERIKERRGVSNRLTGT